MLEDLLNEAVEKFNKRVEEDAELRKAVEGKKRKVLIELKDGRKYNILLENGKMGNPKIGDIDEPDIRISSSSEILEKILKKEMKVIKAYALGKLKIKGKLEDILTIKKFM